MKHGAWFKLRTENAHQQMLLQTLVSSFKSNQETIRKDCELAL
jgi:hypothetical protein